MPLLAFFLLLLSRVVPTQFCSLAIQVLFQLPPPPKALTSLASLIKKATAAPNSDIVQTEEEEEEESQNERARQLRELPQLAFHINSGEMERAKREREREVDSSVSGEKFICSRQSDHV